MALQQAAMGNGKIGSIGAAWPPAFDQNNNRIKGICPKVIASGNALRQVCAQAQSVRHEGATRTTFRAFVKREVLAEGIHGSANGFSVEARIPADRLMRGFDLVYFGQNSESRVPHQNTRKEEERLLCEVVEAVVPVDREIALARLTERGYEISMPQNGSVSNERDVRTLLNLYREAYELYTFPINEQTIRIMLGNGNRVIVARDSRNDISSVLIAESCEIKLENGKTALLYELSDFATFRKDRGEGLMTALQIEAVRFIRSLPGGERAIIYAEDRAPWQPVNRSSRQAGMEYAGTLPWHCKIISDRTVNYRGEYESLNVWYAP